MLLAPFQKYISAGLLFLCIMLGIGWQIEKRHARKSDQRIVELTAKLNDISSERNEQREQTKERIKIVTQTIRVAEDKAGVVEKAPLPGQCRTPKEVLQADL